LQHVAGADLTGGGTGVRPAPPLNPPEMPAAIVSGLIAYIAKIMSIAGAITLTVKDPHS